MQFLDRKAERLNRCPDAQALLPAYVEGELSANERSRLEGHLQICAACRTEEADFRTTLGAFRNAPKQECPRDLYYGFAARLEAAENRNRRFARKLRYAGAAACLLLVAGVSASPLIQLLTRKASPSAVKMQQIDTARIQLPKDPLKFVNVPINIDTDKHWKPAKPDLEKKAEPASPENTPSVSPSTREKASPEHTQSASAMNQDNLDFWHVQDKQGHSAADKLAALRAKPSGHNTTDEAASGPIPKDQFLRKETASLAPYTPDRFERVEVGGMETTIKTGYKLDEEGRKKGVHIEIGTTQEK